MVLLGGFDDPLELFGAFGPGERRAGGVVAGKKPVEQIFEVLLGALYAVRQPLLA